MTENRSTPPRDCGKYGEIWRDEYDQEYLIVKDNGGICNTLVLKEICGSYAIPCECGRARYVVPAQLGFLRTSALVQKTGIASNMPAIAFAVAESLGFAFDYAAAVNQNAEQPPETDAAFMVDQLRHECSQLGVYKTMYENIIDRLIAANVGR